MHHLDRINRPRPRGSLATQHHRVSTIDNRIGHVTRFGTGRAWVTHHRIKHLGGGNHRHPHEISRLDDAFLGEWHQFRGHFDTQITPGHHHPITQCEDSVEVFERLAQPLVGGIYGADPYRLSLRATMPRFVEAERVHRSVTLGLLRSARAAGPREGASGARYGLFVAFRRGMATLVDSLTGALGPRVRTNAQVAALAPQEGGGYRVALSDGSALAAEGVVLALPPAPMARLLVPIDAHASALVGGIALGSAATVTLAYRRADVPHALDAYGWVVPAIERRPSLAATFASVKYAGRAPEGWVLVRVFFGGAQGEAVLAGASCEPHPPARAP